MNQSEEVDKNLLGESSLWSIYWKYRGVNKLSPINATLLITFGIISTTLLQYGQLSSEKMIPIVNDFVNVELQCATGILGFLIAGYTIFISMTKSTHIKHLAECEYCESRISVLKYINLIFINTFIQIVVFLVYLTALKGVFYPGGNDLVVSDISARIQMIILSLWSFTIVLYLKSFLYNIYSVYMIVVMLDMDSESEEGNIDPSAKSAERSDKSC